jgi:hypothetical protein
VRAPGNREGLRVAVFLILLVGLIAVLGTRAVHLARQPDALSGIDERKWFQSSGPVAMAEEAFGSVRGGLPAGGEVWVTLPPGWDPGWWGWMARYHLPEQRIAGVLQSASGAPEGAWVVAVSPEGKAAVRRQSP